MKIDTGTDAYNFYEYREYLDVMNRSENCNPEELCSESFIDELTKQITEQLIILLKTNIKVLKKYDIDLNIISSEFWCTYNLDSYSFMRVEIKDKFANSDIFWVRWKSLDDNIVYVLQTQDITDIRVKFEICEDIPYEIKADAYKHLKDKNIKRYEELVNSPLDKTWIAEIKTILSLKTIIKASKSGFKFDYEISCNWPDVIFEFYFYSEVFQEKLDKVERVFAYFSETWNKNHTKKGQDKLIHYIGKPVITDTKACQMHIDFGNSNPNIIKKIIKLYNESDLDIGKIVLL